MFFSSYNRSCIKSYRWICVIMLMLTLAVSVSSIPTRNHRYPDATPPTLTGTIPASPESRIVRTLSDNDNSTVINGTRVKLSYFVRFEDCSCGGTLIRHNLVLTSAFCATGCTSSTYVYVGSSNTSNGQRINITKKIPHPSFDPNTAQHDIAILRLSCSSRNMPLSPNFKKSDLKANGTVSIAGFGESVDLQAADILPFTNVDCRKKMVSDFFTFNGSFQFCGGGPTGIAASSPGDYGGPVTLFIGNSTSNKTSLVGIYSWGFSPAGTLPDMYVRVAAYSRFIRNNTRLYTPPLPSYCS